jgi:hypothetical protein
MEAGYKPYSSEELESIKSMLEAEAREGNPLFYEVKVDNNTCIHRTCKPERFDELHNFLNERSKHLVIVVYPYASRNTKNYYKYAMNADERTLSGAELPTGEQNYKEELKHMEERWEARRTQEKLAETERMLADAEEYIEELTQQLMELKAKPNHFGGLDLGKLAGTAIQGIALNYPKVFEKVPVLNGIAEAIQESTPPKPGTHPEGEVSYKMKTPSGQKDTARDEHFEAIKRLSDFIAGHFDSDERTLLGLVIEALGDRPDQLPTVASLLNIDMENEGHPEAQ